MPKKSKRLKRLADIHRKTSSTPQGSSFPSTSIPEDAKSTIQNGFYSFVSEKHTAHDTPTAMTTTHQTELFVIRQDIIKTVFFSLCAIGIELLLYVRLEVMK